ncbi:hypothetical protein C8R43DRAFT_1234085 [Mycena crocata]|nr:hypothetical protein C8R43DRAFT_1234085 [Mycena crocata]
MFFKKSLLSAASAAMLFGVTNAFTGIASLGFEGVTSCDCPATNGPVVVAVPAALIGTAVCCRALVTLNYNGKSVTAHLSGVFDAGAGTENVALGPFTFGVLADDSSQTTLSPVTWAFD